MKKVVLLIALAVFAQFSVAYAAGIVLKIRQPERLHNPNLYDLTLSKNGKLVVHVREETGSPPQGYLDAYTFPGAYCGKPAQAILIAYDSVPGGDPQLGGTHIIEYIFNAKTWDLMYQSENDEPLDDPQAYINQYHKRFKKGRQYCQDLSDDKLFKETNLANARRK